MITDVINTKNQTNQDPVFGQSSFDNHEQIVFCNDKDTGLKAIIGIHNTVLGPALGGTRMWNYANEWEALNDVLRLSRVGFQRQCATIPSRINIRHIQ